MTSSIAVILHVALSLKPAPDPIGVCEREFRAQPDVYEHARCFYSRTNGVRDRALARLQQLRVEYPESVYLAVTQGHFYWRKSLATARELYERASALAKGQSHDDGEALAVANLLATYLSSGDEAAIREQLTRLEAIERRAQSTVARARAVVAVASARNANYWSIGEQYRKLQQFSEREIESLPYSVQRPLLLGRGHAAFQHGEYEQALEDARFARDLGLQSQDDDGIAQAQQLRARVWSGKLNMQPGSTRRTDVLEAFEDFLESAKRAGNVKLEALAHVGLAGLMVAKTQRLSQGLMHAEACLELAEHQSAQILGRCYLVTSQLLRRQEPSLAYAHAQSALELLGQTASRLDRALAWRNLSRGAFALGFLPEARWISNRALDEIELLRSEQSDVVAKTRVFSTWADDYYWLANQYLQSPSLEPTERVSLAFELAERAKARNLLESWQDRNRREQSKESSELWQRGTLSSTEGASFRLPPLAELQGMLREDEVLVAYQSTDERDASGDEYGGTWSYVITQDQIQARQLDMDRNALVASLGKLRGALGTTLEQELLDTIRRKIWSELQDLLPSHARRVIVVPDGPLSAVPWPAMDRSRLFSVVPSASFWWELRSNPHHPKAANAVAVLDPEIHGGSLAAKRGPASQVQASGVLARLPFSQREGRWIRKWVHGGVQTLVGEGATKPALLEAWRGTHNLLHISAHSVAGTQTGEQVKIALASHGSPGQDWLQEEDIESMDLKGALVVLAGCSTALGEQVRGEAALSLAYAFQRAGARAVVASLWPVRDRMASEFFRRLYQEIGAGETVEQAVASAQLALIQAGESLEDTGSFVVLGDGAYRFEATNAPKKTLGLELAGYALLALSGVAVLVYASMRKKRRTRRDTASS